MDWEGFWLLATSCSGPKAMKARRELVESVKRALSNERNLEVILAATEERLRRVEASARALQAFAVEAASDAGRTLAEWKQARESHGSIYRALEEAGQLTIEYPDPPPVLHGGHDELIG